MAKHMALAERAKKNVWSHFMGPYILLISILDFGPNPLNVRFYMLSAKNLFANFADTDLTNLIAFRNCLAQFKTELRKGADNTTVAVHSDIAQCGDLLLRNT